MTAVLTSTTTPNASLLTVSDLARRFSVPEQTVRGWLSDFNWERRYDAQGQLCFSSQDAELLGLIQSLETVENSCTSLATLLSTDAPEPESDAEATDAPLNDDTEDDESASDLAQVETLKAELRDLHGNRPDPVPFWQFWRRW